MEHDQVPGEPHPSSTHSPMMMSSLPPHLRARRVTRWTMSRSVVASAVAKVVEEASIEAAEMQAAEEGTAYGVTHGRT